MNERIEALRLCLAMIPQAPYPFHSRIHTLKTYSLAQSDCFVKRDDELGWGISGSKIRKYRTLVPFLMHANIQEVILIGGINSNHVLSITQLLIENRFRVKLFLRGDPFRPLQGNGRLLSLLVPPHSIQWITKADWKNVLSHARDYASTSSQSYVLLEGGFDEHAFPGALTLPLDITLNEAEAGFTFNHIFIDAGTGFTASALILGLHWIRHAGTVHVVLLADGQAQFLAKLNACKAMFEKLIGHTRPLPNNFILYLPTQSGKFGTIKRTVFEEITALAQNEGFFTDPIYSGKLFLECKHLLKQGCVEGKVLIHHSGGALSLMGFEKQLSRCRFS